jgi:hypothetical protein
MTCATSATARAPMPIRGAPPSSASWRNARSPPQATLRKRKQPLQRLTSSLESVPSPSCHSPTLSRHDCAAPWRWMRATGCLGGAGLLLVLSTVPAGAQQQQPQQPPPPGCFTVEMSHSTQGNPQGSITLTSPFQNAITTLTLGFPPSSVSSCTVTRTTTLGLFARAFAHSRSIISAFSTSVSRRRMNILRDKWPCSRRTAEQRDELAASYSEHWVSCRWLCLSYISNQSEASHRPSAMVTSN